MRKIVLNESNYKQVVGLMQKMLKYSFRVTHGRNTNVKKLKMKDVRNAWKTGKHFMSKPAAYPGIIVSPHPFTDPKYETSSDRNSGRKPLVHLDYGYGRASVYYAGDVFYFYGGNMIKVNRCSKGARWFFAIGEYDVAFDIFIRGIIDNDTFFDIEKFPHKITGRMGKKGVISKHYPYETDIVSQSDKKPNIPSIIAYERK